MPVMENLTARRGFALVTATAEWSGGLMGSGGGVGFIGELTGVWGGWPVEAPVSVRI